MMTEFEFLSRLFFKDVNSVHFGFVLAVQICLEIYTLVYLRYNINLSDESFLIGSANYG